jgi:hypothetical protein
MWNARGRIVADRYRPPVYALKRFFLQNLSWFALSGDSTPIQEEHSVREASGEIEMVGDEEDRHATVGRRSE